MALVTNPLAVFCIVMTGIGSAVGRVLDRSGDLSHRVVSFWARTILVTSGVRLDVTGRERVPREGGVLLVSNHLSMMDIPVLMASLPVSFRFVAKKSLFRTVDWAVFPVQFRAQTDIESGSRELAL
jgi:1-acyl-sn-glycerol-3-phosphate acyltransferase